MLISCFHLRVCSVSGSVRGAEGLKTPTLNMRIIARRIPSSQLSTARLRFITQEVTHPPHQTTSFTSLALTVLQIVPQHPKAHIRTQIIFIPASFMLKQTQHPLFHSTLNIFRLDAHNPTRHEVHKWLQISWKSVSGLTCACFRCPAVSMGGNVCVYQQLTDTSLSLYVTAAKALRVGWFLLTCSSMGGKAVQLSSKMADTFDVSSSF